MESVQEGVTAEEYLAGQRQLELEAREIMPYEPDTCTYPNSLRQLVFACLTCQNAGQPVGVCYSCSIQCHSTHDLVELFSKRGFVCDCGTERMKGSACSIRERAHLNTIQKPGRSNSSNGSNNPIAGVKMRTGSGSEDSRPWTKQNLGPATDIPSSENTYNQNFQGRFCDCKILYDPEKETRTMHQCFFGEACGEDWYHEDCIVSTNDAKVVNEGNKDKSEIESKPETELEPETEEKPKAQVETEVTPGTEEKPDNEAKSMKVESEASKNSEITNGSEVQALSAKCFSEFVCWKCVDMYSGAFDELCGYPKIAARLLHNETRLKVQSLSLESESHTEEEPPQKRHRKGIHYSIFLQNHFRPQLATLSESLPESSALKRLLRNYTFFHKDDPVYEPPEDDTASNASESSLYDLGSSALSSLPVPQALEGLQAYDTMKEKLRGFFKGFVDQNKIVTEKEIREFFGKMEEERRK